MEWEVIELVEYIPTTFTIRLKFALPVCPFAPQHPTICTLPVLAHATPCAPPLYLLLFSTEVNA